MTLEEFYLTFAVAMLCTPEAGWITRQTITADGGALLMNADFSLAIQMG